MAEPARQWLTTGGIARLCSVKPDTVQKWIRKGRIQAQRTVGGHYRIALHDVEPFLTGRAEARWFPPPPVECRPQPLRCWEYLSDNGVTRDECTKCVVYRVRATWCFEVLGVGVGAGHSRQFCRNQKSCEDCLYYRRVCGPSVGVLLITSDQALVSRLSGQSDKSLSLMFASNAYEASALIGSSRPGFVIVDEDLCNGAEPMLLDCLLRDNRVPGLKVALCGPRRRAAPAGRQVILGRLEKPFDREAIRELVNALPVERRPMDEDRVQKEAP